MDADVARVASLLADPARARMLDSLLAGRALPAGELARRAGVTPPTASAHLRRLLDGGLLRAGALRPAAGRDYEVTPEGQRLLGGLGVDVSGLRRQRRAFARGCLDWTERTPHLSGALGAALLERLLGLGWLGRGRVPRGLVLTDAGRDGLAGALACQLPTPRPG